MAANQERDMQTGNGYRTEASYPRGALQASYEETPPLPETPPEYVPPPFTPPAWVTIAWVIIGIVALLGAGLALYNWANSSKTGGSTSASISTLDQSQTRLAGEVSAQRQQITSLHRVVAADSSALSALRAKVDDDISCADLAKMKLLETTGGSVSSVPGSVDLSQSPVPLPKPCTPGG